MKSTTSALGILFDLDGTLARETGAALDAARGDRLRRRHAAELLQRLGEIRPLRGATQLVSALDDAGGPYALATSGRRETADFTPPLLQLRPDVTIVTRDDVPHA